MKNISLDQRSVEHLLKIFLYLVNLTLSLTLNLGAYLVKKIIIHNKYFMFLFFEDNDSISANSAAQILYLILHSLVLF